MEYKTGRKSAGPAGELLSGLSYKTPMTFVSATVNRMNTISVG
jgi:hypothetical protein